VILKTTKGSLINAKYIVSTDIYDYTRNGNTWHKLAVSLTNGDQYTVINTMNYDDIQWFYDVLMTKCMDGDEVIDVGLEVRRRDEQ